jgi:hypothetical protein
VGFSNSGQVDDIQYGRSSSEHQQDTVTVNSIMCNEVKTL